MLVRISPVKRTRRFRRVPCNHSGQFQIDGLGALRIGLNIEGNALALVQAAQACLLNGRNVNENVLATAFWSDETKSLGSVEKFHGSDRHLLSPEEILTTFRHLPTRCDWETIRSEVMLSASAAHARRVRIHNSALQVREA